jgi:hypothetical protein
MNESERGDLAKLPKVKNMGEDGFRTTNLGNVSIDWVVQ